MRAIARTLMLPIAAAIALVTTGFGAIAHADINPNTGSYLCGSNRTVGSWTEVSWNAIAGTGYSEDFPDVPVTVNITVYKSLYDKANSTSFTVTSSRNEPFRVDGSRYDFLRDGSTYRVLITANEVQDDGTAAPSRCPLNGIVGSSRYGYALPA